MTGKTIDRAVLRVLGGEAIWPPPVWLMRQAGRYLPEYRKLRATAGNFIALSTTPAMATEATLQPVRRFGLDAAILFSDILILPWALGQKLRYAEGEGPVMERIETLADLEVLNLHRLKPGTESVMETVSRARAELPAETTLIGFAGSPFTVACYMLDGRGGNFARTLGLAYSDPGLLASVIETVTTATIDYLSWQIEAGADCVMLFDSWAGLLPPDLFRAHVIHPTARIVNAVRHRHPGVHVIGFPRLAGLMALPYIAETGISAFGMDTATDAPALARLLPRKVALQGNLDPLLLRAGGVSLNYAVERIAGELAGLPHIFNLGHGVLPDTPPEHVAMLIEHLRSLDRPPLETSRETATSSA
ncbi:MAG: uroporphyrinogen decarboxylase [Acidiphilium sp.]|nr:uroporphyrinogen decarboxylase [Acidiphilium sp.]MDD4936767.1 uroporphyrinogen decarboxylase [Acidiphilium sp.]